MTSDTKVLVAPEPINQALIGRRDPYALLGADGRLLRDFEVDVKLLRKMYETMVLARTFDDKAINLGVLNEIGAYAPYSGQEAIQVGTALAMAEGDWLVPTFRDSGLMIARGVPIVKLLQFWGWDEFGMQLNPELHVLPPTIPVATQIPHATGLALSLKLKGLRSAVVATIGDGGTSKGDFYEGLNMAGVLGVPLLVAVENNQYAISVPRSKQTAALTLAQKAVACGVDGYVVDGNDVLAVYEAVRFALDWMRRGGGPVLIEFVTYRLKMHTTAELVSSKKRAPEEVDAWAKMDPLARVEAYLRSVAELDDAEVQRIRDWAKESVGAAVAEFRGLPRPEPKNMFLYMYSDVPQHLREQYVELTGESLPNNAAPQEEAPPTSGEAINMRNSINRALRQLLEEDPKVLVFGEDVGRLGGVFQVTRGLQEAFGEERVFDTPLSEAGIAGLFVGLSLGGFTPIAEFQFDGFTPPAFDQIINHISRYRNRTRGAFVVRGIIRFPYGGGVRGIEHHSDSPEVYFTATPGLKVVVPSNPYDAKGLLLAAAQTPDPVVFMEPKKLYDTPKMDVPETRYTVPIGKANVLSEGDDVTVVAYGAMVHPALEAAKDFSADVIDLRTLSPMDTDAIRRSVEKTGRLVVVHEAQRCCGIGAELAARIAESTLDYLKAPVRRVTGYDVVTPLAKLEDWYRPTPDKIRAAIRQVLSH